MDQCYLHAKTVSLRGGTPRSCWFARLLSQRALIKRGGSCSPNPLVEFIRNVSTIPPNPSRSEMERAYSIWTSECRTSIPIRESLEILGSCWSDKHDVSLISWTDKCVARPKVPYSHAKNFDSNASSSSLFECIFRAKRFYFISIMRSVRGNVCGETKLTTRHESSALCGTTWGP